MPSVIAQTECSLTPRIRRFLQEALRKSFFTSKRHCPPYPSLVFLSTKWLFSCDENAPKSTERAENSAPSEGAFSVIRPMKVPCWRAVSAFICERMIRWSLDGQPDQAEIPRRVDQLSRKRGGETGEEEREMKAWRPLPGRSDLANIFPTFCLLTVYVVHHK